jgi:hypothetical protein
MPAQTPAKARVGRPDKFELPQDYREPPPKVGMVATELGPKLPLKASGVPLKAKVTCVHSDGRYLVARLETTGAGYTYARQSDGTYRLAGLPRAGAPRLVLGIA